MCGILGSVNINSTSEFLDLIEHRGPDSYGQKSFRLGPNSVSLLHRRLAILDLSDAGNQPMASSDKRGYIVFNGEIYNHRQLKKNMTNVFLKGHSDTETIVNYFENNPILGCISELNGIFALAYLDVERQHLYLARDRFGVKPLYYYFDNDRLMFSSEIRPLKAYLKPFIEKGAALNSLKMRFSPSPISPYEKIVKVEPGQIITFDLQKKAIAMSKRYFVECRRLGGRRGEVKKLINKYGDLFEKAVGRQLMADVDVGILLSGGVDSALVAAVAKEKSKNVPKAFTIGFDGNHIEDEIKYAEETADILGLEHFSHKIDSLDFQNSLKEIIKIVEEPIGTTSIIPMYFLSKLAASHVKVVLSGQGADEPLGGYYKYKALSVLDKRRYFRRVSSFIDKFNLLNNHNENARRVFSAIQQQDTVACWMEFNAISSSREIKKILNAQFLDSGMHALESKQELIYNVWKERTPNKFNLKNLFLYYDTRTSLSDDLLMYTDKITMHHSLECRVPILDNELMEFIESLDSDYKFDVRKGKIIHKEFAKEYLPASIIERKKLDFNSPTETWFRENIIEIKNIFFENDSFKELFDFNGIQQILNNHLKGKNLEKQIFMLLSLNYLIEDSKVNTAREF